MKRKNLLIIVSVFFASFLAFSCSNKNTDPTTTTTANKGIETYQGNWYMEGYPYEYIFMTINSDGSIDFRYMEGAPTINKSQITDKGNEVYEFLLIDSTVTITFTDNTHCNFNSKELPEPYKLVKIN